MENKILQRIIGETINEKKKYPKVMFPVKRKSIVMDLKYI